MSAGSSLSGVSSLAGRVAPGSAIELYARETPGFDGRVAAALQRLRDAAQAHPGRIVQATSLGAEDMVVTDLIARHSLPIALATLDTGTLHAPTVELMGRLEQRYGLPLRRFQPAQTQVVHFVATHGPKAMYDSLALRKACCALRKLEPLQRLLAGHTAWVTGLRREQSDGRAEVPFEEAGADERTKFNPLADWSWADVWHYIRLHDVPFNPLHDAFMPSIGCEPCTRAIAVGEPFRAGRWWWESEAAKECGLHVNPHSDDAQASSLAPGASGSVASAQAHVGEADVKAATAAGRSQEAKAKECGLHVADNAHDDSNTTRPGIPA